MTGKQYLQLLLLSAVSAVLFLLFFLAGLFVLLVAAVALPVIMWWIKRKQGHMGAAAGKKTDSSYTIETEYSVVEDTEDNQK